MKMPPANNSSDITREVVCILARIVKDKRVIKRISNIVQPVALYTLKISEDYCWNVQNAHVHMHVFMW